MKNSTLKDPKPSDMSIYIVRNIAHTYGANDALDNPTQQCMNWRSPTRTEQGQTARGSQREASNSQYVMRNL